MRLLQLKKGGGVSLVDIYGDIPAYAILSHTWGADGDEVTFKDIAKGRGTDKAGYRKIQFCIEQATNDGLQYFWVDTCCIDKSSSAELSEAINSMFRWYQNAAKCYVYLADVSIKGWSDGVMEGDLSVGETRKLILEQSRWFTRGWTLQELLAPTIVEFFSLEGKQLGDKQTLVRQIHEITHIAIAALHGAPLSEFGVDERMSWAANRKTKREEDAAYSLFGLFDLHMPLLYGEGRKKALVRLLREVSMVHSERDTDFPSGVLQEPQRRLSNRTIETNDQLPKDETAVAYLSEAAGQTLTNVSGDLSDAPDPNRASKSSNGILAAEIPQQHEIFLDDPRSAEDIAARERAAEMQMWWEESVARNMRPEGYVKVAVLLVKWADELDELKTRGDVQELETVFRDRFNFHTQIAELNISTKPQLQLNRYLSTLIESYDGPDNLLIVYYNGHGIFREDLRFLEICGSLGRFGSAAARANWTKVEELLRSDEIESDVLAILDTCYASNSMTSGPARSGQESRKCELLSACAIDSTTAAPGPYSFTRSLVDALIELLNEFGDRSFSTYHLNQRILLDKRRYDTPSQLWFILGNNERPIHLARLKNDAKGVERTDRLIRFPPQAYVTLRLALSKDLLNKDQIELMARALAKSLGNKTFFGVRRIDWVGFEPAVKRPFEKAALALFVIMRWKKAVMQKRREHVTKRKFDELESPTSNV